jgi:hypothetical protein
MEDDRVAGPTDKETRMNEQALGQLMAEDTALHLFQIAALMLGDEQEAVSLVEESVARVEADPCAEGTLAYDEARALLVQTAVQRMAGLYPEAFSVPSVAPADAVRPANHPANRHERRRAAALLRATVRTGPPAAAA